MEDQISEGIRRIAIGDLRVGEFVVTEEGMLEFSVIAERTFRECGVVAHRDISDNGDIYIYTSSDVEYGVVKFVLESAMREYLSGVGFTIDDSMQ